MMRRMAAGVVLVTVGLAALGAQQAPPAPVFRASTASVSVDVSVRQNGRPVTDLAPGDFEVLDAGVAQQVTEVVRETLPIDVTCIIDLSGSVQGPVLEALTRAVTSVGERLRPTDRATVLTFNHQIRQVRPLAAGGWSNLSIGTPSGLTSLFDAVTLSLISSPEVGRRRMVIVFTDGLDTTSFLDGAGMIEIARRSSSSVFIVALSEGTVRRPEPPAHEALFAALADTTGGALETLQRDEDISGTFAQAFDDFRTSYVLNYTYEGPPRAGWHPLDVQVRRADAYEVRARQGYFSTGE